MRPKPANVSCSFSAATAQRVLSAWWCVAEGRAAGCRLRAADCGAPAVTARALPADGGCTPGVEPAQRDSAREMTLRSVVVVGQPPRPRRRAG